MRRPMAFWKQLLIACGVLAAAGVGWSERETISVFMSDAPVSATAEAGERRSGAAARGGEGRGNGAGQRQGRRGGGRRDGAPAPVIVATVAPRADNLALDLVGTARAQRSVDLRLSGSGQVVMSRLEAGASVEQGDELLRLDDEAAALEADLARARRDAAQRAFERQQRLERSGATSDASLDAAQTEAALARIELARAERAQRDMTLIAPFAGVIGLPRVEIGDWVDQSDVVATLDDRSTLLIEAAAPETLIARTTVGANVSLRSASAPGATLTGEIIAIDSRIDPATRAATLRVALANPDDALRPGASFVMTLDFPGPEYPAAPELALQYGRDGLFVWRIRDGQAQRAPVRLVRRQAGVVLLESLDAEDPLLAGDLVVIEGAQRMRSGAAVRVIGDPIDLETAE